MRAKWRAWVEGMTEGQRFLVGMVIGAAVPLVVYGLIWGIGR